MKIAFQRQSFSQTSQKIIVQAETIIREYLKDGLRLTLRQLYYQFVSRGYLANRQKEYRRLGNIINDARLAGLIDWDAIEDRGRNLQAIPAWDSPESIIDACARQYQIDLWEDQDYRVEVWIEKQALEGVVEKVCRELRVPYFSCKGYVSQSEMFDAGFHRLAGHVQNGQQPIILHFGDHDPSGIDMTRDITERLRMFMSTRGQRLEIRRLALNMDQIEEYNPPPNPAKVTDSRFEEYQRLHGDESWELDALEPKLLVKLIRSEILSLRDPGRWDKRAKKEKEQRDSLTEISSNYGKVVKYLKKTKKEK
jgi:hypothetical protein